MLFPLTLTLDFERVLDNATFLKKLSVQNIDLIHVISSTSRDSTAILQYALQEAMKIIRQKGFDVNQARLAEGNAASEIAAAAREGNYSLLFVPAINKNMMVRTFLGHTTSDLIRITEVPTLIYKNFTSAPVHWETVLFATDFEVAATRALPYIKFTARAAKKLVILHMGTRAADPNAEKRRLDNIKNKLDHLKTDLKPHWQEVNTITQLGNSARGISANVNKFKADLVIMGRGNDTSFKKQLLGSTAEQVCNAVRSSVLLIP